MNFPQKVMLLVLAAEFVLGYAAGYGMRFASPKGKEPKPAPTYLMVTQRIAMSIAVVAVLVAFTA